MHLAKSVSRVDPNNPRDSVADVAKRLKGGSMVFAPQKTAPRDP